MKYTLEAVKVCMECLRPTRSYISTTFRCWFRRAPLWAEAVAGSASRGACEASSLFLGRTPLALRRLDLDQGQATEMSGYSNRRARGLAHI